MENSRTSYSGPQSLSKNFTLIRICLKLEPLLLVPTLADKQDVSVTLAFDPAAAGGESAFPLGPTSQEFGLVA